MKRFASLRARIFLLILLGAHLPLAMAGWWLSRTSVRSAEQLLLAQLDTSVATIASRVADAWSYRRGDLLFVAGNEVVLRTLTRNAAPPTLPDSQFMQRTCAGIRPAILRIRILAVDGLPVWECGADATGGVSGRMPDRQGMPRFSGDDRISVDVPVNADDGGALGTVEAEVRFSALLPGDSLPIPVRGAVLTATDRGSDRVVLPAGGQAAPGSVERFTREGEPWMAAHRSLRDPQVDLAVASPMKAYVDPFVRAATIGWLVFAAITILTLVLATYVTRRMTGSLERLVEAADAVAAGDLDRNVEANGIEEVGKLGRAFNTMTESLRRTLNELSQKQALAAVGEFAASLSHEVRNGLTAIRLDLQRVEERTPAVDTTGQLVTRALTNVKRLDSAVSGSLAVARSGRTSFSSLDLGSVLASAVADSQGAFVDAGATLETSLESARNFTVRGDAVALEQLFLNLLLNAAQALPAGGRAILDVERHGERCTVIIRDTGPGMTAEQLARVGLPMRSSKSGGTGLGLTIASRIASAHGGSLRLESPPGSGLIVRVGLPVDGAVA